MTVTCCERTHSHFVVCLALHRPACSLPTCCFTIMGLRLQCESTAVCSVHACNTLFGLNHSHSCPLLCRVSSSISLNAAVFGAVCLSSLLPSPLHVFALMLTAVAMFAVLPNARMVLKVCLGLGRNLSCSGCLQR